MCSDTPKNVILNASFPFITTWIHPAHVARLKALVLGSSTGGRAVHRLGLVLGQKPHWIRCSDVLRWES